MGMVRCAALRWLNVQRIEVSGGAPFVSMKVQNLFLTLSEVVHTLISLSFDVVSYERYYD